MDTDVNPVAKKLLESFIRFRRLNVNFSAVEGLTPREILVLLCINDKMSRNPQGVKVSDISNQLNVASPTITQILNCLVDRGFVERSADKEDRRAVRIKLTEKGMPALHKSYRLLQSFFDGLVKHLGENKSNELAELLTSAYAYVDMKKHN
jgi:DNA-binding MarR family transcriptional regulator